MVGQRPVLGYRPGVTDPEATKPIRWVRVAVDPFEPRSTPAGKKQKLRALRDLVHIVLTAGTTHQCARSTLIVHEPQ